LEDAGQLLLQDPERLGSKSRGLADKRSPEIAETPILMQFAMKVKIIELRFGRYGNLRPIRMSISNVAKRVSIARSTVYKIIQKYVENDGVISSIPEKQERRKIIERSVNIGNQ
jgi:hypothetical protein